MAADEFIWKVSNATEPVIDPRVIEARFGGGNRQVMAEGDKNITLVLNVVINNIDMDVLWAIHQFLKGKGGWQRFTWTPPYPFSQDGQKYWLCQHWRTPYNGGRAMNFTGTFDEMPTP